MKILALSDETCPALYDYYVPGRLAEYDLIISCGDLNAKYLLYRDHGKSAGAVCPR